MARAGRPGLRITGGAKAPAAPGSPARKRMLPERSRTTLSGMPSPLKSARNGVSRQTDAAAGRRRLEGAVTLAQQHADRAVVVADGDQVGPAVAVDVRHDGLDRRLGRWRRSAGCAKEPSPLFSRTLTLLPP